MNGCSSVRLYGDRDFDQVLEMAAHLLQQNRKDAEGVIRWASRSDSAKLLVAEAD